MSRQYKFAASLNDSEFRDFKS